MIKVVYVDSLFILNFAIDFVLIALTADLRGIWCSRKRQLLAAALGGLLAVLLYVPSLPMPLALLMRAGSCAVLCLTAYRVRGRELLRCCVLLFLLSAALAGVMAAILLLTAGRAPVEIRNGVLWVGIPIWKQAACVVAAWCLLRMLFHSGSLRADRRHRHITIRSGDRAVALRALVDTGNYLREPVTGKRVILVDRAALAPLLVLPPERQDPVELMQWLTESGEGASLMQFRTAGQEDGMLVVWRPREILEEGAPLEGYTVGIAPAELCTGDGCRAIIGG